jgi:hypothetical protein
MNLLNPAKSDDAAVDQARRERAYAEGREDASATVTDRAVIHERDAAVREAYDRGRRDERARRPRRGFPLIGLVVLLVAGAGAYAIYLGVHEGSFARGGQMVDQSLSNTTSTASQATHQLADKAGDALQNAGQKIKQTAGDGR